MVVTGIVQSSSITTGLCILLVRQTILPAPAAIPIVIGANRCSELYPPSWADLRFIGPAPRPSCPPPWNPNTYGFS